MHNQKHILVEEILNKMKKYCAFQERCVSDVKKKIDTFIYLSNQIKTYCLDFANKFFPDR